MRKNKITQAQIIFYQLYLAFKIDPKRFVPVWKLIGEVYIAELRIWKFVSYQASAQMSEMKSKNPNLFESTKVIGKTGAKYNAYRLNQNSSPDLIKDPELKLFYEKIKRNKEYRERIADFERANGITP